MESQVICRIGKSDAKKNAEQTAYKKEITDYIKKDITSHIRSIVVSEMNGGI